MISKGNHVKFARFVLAVSEEAKTPTSTLSILDITKPLSNNCLMVNVCSTVLVMVMQMKVVVVTSCLCVFCLFVCFSSIHGVYLP